MIRNSEQRARSVLVRLLATAGAALSRVTARRATAGVVAAFLALVGTANPVLVGFRCLATDTFHDRPCCAGVDAGAHAEDRLAGTCCVMEVREAPAVVADGTPQHDASLPLPFLPARPAFLAELSIARPAAARTQGPPPGPPLRLRDCSLLI